MTSSDSTFLSIGCKHVLLLLVSLPSFLSSLLVFSSLFGSQALKYDSFNLSKSSSPSALASV